MQYNIIDLSNGAEHKTYSIEEYTTPTCYDDPLLPDPTWFTAYFAQYKEYKTLRGAENALSKHLKLTNRRADKFRIVANAA